MTHGIEILKKFTFGRCVVKVANVEALGAPGALDDALCRLSHDRCEKTLKYRFEKGKWLSAGAGLLLDNLLQEHGLRERDMEYTQGEHGKPAFVSHPELYFNISHSGTLVACALGDQPVGVDVQTLVNPSPSLVSYTMSKEEIAQLEDLNDEEKKMLFTQLWTLKECYLKATGQGLSHEFPSFKVGDDGSIAALSALTPPAFFKTIKLPNAIVSAAIIDPTAPNINDTSNK